MVFFSVSALRQSRLSILADDLNQYYSIKIQLHNTQQTNEKLQKLIDGYSEMITSISNPTRISSNDLPPSLLASNPIRPIPPFQRQADRNLSPPRER